MHYPKTLLVVAGPTASGKTALALELAHHFQTAILSFDSRQCYRELHIAVAKPTETELAQVPHYFINSHPIHQPVDAAAYETYALQVLQQLFLTHDVVVAVGGTGLYLKALCEGIDAMPPIPEELRQSIRQEYEAKGIGWLQQSLQQEDPEYARHGEMQNPHRMLRALEVMRASGRSIRDYQSAGSTARPFRIVKIGLDMPRPALHERINHRVDQMVEAGLVEEARALYPLRHLQALQTVGYRELFEYFDGKISLEQAIADIKTNTRQYAKRQMTWFRKDPSVHWFHPAQQQEIVEYAVQQASAH